MTVNQLSLCLFLFPALVEQRVKTAPAVLSFWSSLCSDDSHRCYFIFLRSLLEMLPMNSPGVDPCSALQTFECAV
jgi:hypothetical protein